MNKEERCKRAAAVKIIEPGDPRFPKPDLQLLSPADARTEKELGSIIKDVNTFTKGVRKAGAEMYGYTFLKGMRLLRAKEIVPHGNFIPWCEQNFPDEPHRTLTWTMGFAEEMKSKLATIANLKSNPLLLGAKKIGKKDQETILTVVPEMMGDNGSIAEFMRNAKLLREPKHQTHHKPKELTPEEKLDAQREQDIALVTTLIGDINQLTEDEDLKTLTNIPPALRQKLEDARIVLGHKIGQLKKTSKK